MKTLPVILVLILFGGLSLAAQTTGNNCPEVKVAGSEYLTKPGKAAIFTASIGSSDQSHKFEYIWTVSLGVIIKGQGTSSISVSTSTKDETPI